MFFQNQIDIFAIAIFAIQFTTLTITHFRLEKITINVRGSSLIYSITVDDEIFGDQDNGNLFDIIQTFQLER